MAPVKQLRQGRAPTKQAPQPTPDPVPSTNYLIPAQLSHLIKDRPLLWSEDRDAYDVLLSSVFAELNPKGAIEAILVKDVADYIWEARRMRRLKAAAMHAELPGAAASLMADEYKDSLDVSLATASGFLKDMIRRSAISHEDEDESLREVMEMCAVTPDVLLYEAYKSGLTTISAINGELERLERRRDQILRSLREHRAALATMAKTLVTREEAEIVQVSSTDPSA